MSKLNANSHAERQAALSAHAAAAEANTAAKIADLKGQIERVKVDHEKAIADARAFAENTRIELAAALLRDFREAMDGGSNPLVTSFLAEPSRATSKRLAEVVRTYQARALLELGTELWEGAIVCAFADRILKDHPNGVSRLAENGWGLPTVQLAIQRVLKGVHGTPAEAFDAFVFLESALIETTRGAPEPNAENRGRYELKREVASRNDFVAGSEKYDALMGKRRDAEFEKSYAATSVPTLVERMRERLGLQP